MVSTLYHNKDIKREYCASDGPGKTLIIVGRGNFITDVAFEWGPLQCERSGVRRAVSREESLYSN